MDGRLHRKPKAGLGPLTTPNFQQEIAPAINMIIYRRSGYKQQAAISQKEMVFRFRKDVLSEKGWGLMSCA